MAQIITSRDTGTDTWRHTGSKTVYSQRSKPIVSDDDWD